MMLLWKIMWDGNFLVSITHLLLQTRVSTTHELLRSVLVSFRIPPDPMSTVHQSIPVVKTQILMQPLYLLKNYSTRLIS